MGTDCKKLKNRKIIMFVCYISIVFVPFKPSELFIDNSK